MAAFVEERRASAKAAMQAMPRDLIDATVASGERCDLPYRLLATVEQSNRAYPQAEEFFAKKQSYARAGLFQSRLFLKYGASPYIEQRHGDSGPSAFRRVSASTEDDTRRQYRRNFVNLWPDQTS